MPPERRRRAEERAAAAIEQLRVWDELGLHARPDGTVGIGIRPDFRDEQERAAWADRVGPAVDAYAAECGLAPWDRR